MVRSLLLKRKADYAQAALAANPLACQAAALCMLPISCVDMCEAVARLQLQRQRCQQLPARSRVLLHHTMSSHIQALTHSFSAVLWHPRWLRAMPRLICTAICHEAILQICIAQARRAAVSAAPAAPVTRKQVLTWCGPHV